MARNRLKGRVCWGSNAGAVHGNALACYNIRFVSHAPQQGEQPNSIKFGTFVATWLQWVSIGCNLQTTPTWCLATAAISPSR